MTTTADFSLDTYRLLGAFHSAAMLRRTPTPACQDGHRKFFSLDQLVLEGRIEPGTGADMCELAREARRMTRKGLLAHRRLYARDFWMVTPAGLHVLRLEVSQHGLHAVLAAALAVEQADYDARHAANVARETRIYFESVAGDGAGRLPSEDSLLYAALHGSVTQ